jgi:protein SCO1/2
MQMRRVTLLAVAVAVWGLVVVSLRGEVPPAPGAASNATYEAQGVLKSIDLEHHQATIAHEAIAGYMPAMTMTFDVPDSELLKTLQPGDLLHFRLSVRGTSAWIEQVRKTGTASSPDFAPATAIPSPQLAAGDLLPDIDLINSAGQSLHSRDFRGQALAITFIYARCPLPTYCPLLNRNFQEAQTLLTRMGNGNHWHFLSVSLDAAHDSPDVLANLASAYGADAQHWTFVTAPEEKVRLLGHSVGLEFNTSGPQISHNLRTVVLDPAGRIRQIYRGNSWTPQELAAEIRAAMSRQFPGAPRTSPQSG